MYSQRSTAVGSKHPRRLNPAVVIGWILFLAAVSIGQSSPADFDRLAQQASAARDQNDAVQAIALYSQALQLNPKWNDGWWFLGLLDYQQSRYIEGMDALSHYIEANPKAGPARAIRGLCEFETADYEQALSDLETGLASGAADHSRNESIVRYHLAQLLTRLGRFSDALQTYAYFAHDENPSPEMLTGLGLAVLGVPLLPKEVSPEKTEVLLAAGRAAFPYLSGNIDAARTAFQSFLQQFPSAPNAHYFCGYFLYPKDLERALEEFKRELEISPSNGQAALMAAWLLLMQNDAAGALPYAKKAAELEPSSSTAELVLGKAQLELDDTQQAMPHLEKALAGTPENLEVHLALATAYSKLGRKDDAQRERLLCLQMAKADARQLGRP